MPCYIECACSGLVVNGDHYGKEKRTPKSRDHGVLMIVMMSMMLERMIKDNHPIAVRCRDGGRLLIAGHWVFKWNPVTCCSTHLFQWYCGSYARNLTSSYAFIIIYVIIIFVITIIKGHHRRLVIMVVLDLLELHWPPPQWKGPLGESHSCQVLPMLEHRCCCCCCCCNL